MKYFIGCGIVMLLAACGADHSRNFTLNCDADSGAYQVLDIETLLEKSETVEESANAPEVEFEIPLSL